MFNKVARLSAVAFALALAPLAAPATASAETTCDGRVFEGKVDKINEKQIIVDNRKGDKLTFVKQESTTVSGLKAKWDDVKAGDWAGVCSKMLEKPRKAYWVEVKNPPADAAVDE